MHFHVLYILQLIPYSWHVQCLKCSIAVSNLAAEWINNTTLRVMWEPVQVTDGVSAAYTVNSSPIIGLTDELQSLSEANVTEFQMSKTTMGTFVIMDNLNPSLFYHVRVMVHLVRLDQYQDPSVAIGELWYSYNNVATTCVQQL